VRGLSEPPAAPDVASLFPLVYQEVPAAISLTRMGDGTFVDANRHMLEMLGYERSEVVGRSAYALGVWREAPRADVQAQLRAHGRARNVELVFYRKDGAQRHCIVSLDVVSVAGAPCVLAVGIDITERRRAEDARSRLLLAVESADDAIMTIDAQGRFLTWNAGAERLFGYSKEEVLGQDGQMLLPPDLPDESKLLADRLRAEGALRDHETKRRRKDGSLVDVSVSINLARDAEGHLIGYTGVMRDITARKRGEEEARRQLVARKLVRGILRALTEGSSATAVSRRALGRTLAADLEGQSLDATLQALRDMGLGAIALAREEAGRYEFHATDMLEAGRGHSTPTCHIALGVLEATVARRHGGHALGSEIRCQSQGEPACVFVVKARDG